MEQHIVSVPMVSGELGSTVQTAPPQSVNITPFISSSSVSFVSCVMSRHGGLLCPLQLLDWLPWHGGPDHPRGNLDILMMDSVNTFSRWTPCAWWTPASAAMTRTAAPSGLWRPTPGAAPRLSRASRVTTPSVTLRATVTSSPEDIRYYDTICL